MCLNNNSQAKTADPSSTIFLSEEVCDGEVFAARCPAGSVVDISSARYGRVKVGRCIAADLGYIGCGKDVLAEMDRWCSGKQECEVEIENNNPDLNEGNTCIRDIVSHLELQYGCVQGILMFYPPFLRLRMFVRLKFS